MATPYLSIAIPIHETPRTAFFLSRLLKSIAEQTFTDYEIVITKEGAMAKNHNAAILQSRGTLVKLLQMDDFFAHPFALQKIVDSFSTDDQWMISACIHTTDGMERFAPHYPEWSDDMHKGNNTLGGFSTLTLRNNNPLLLDETMQWVVDCDLYKRYYDMYGAPKLLNDINVVVDVGEHRLSSTIPDKEKLKEVTILINRYA